MTEDTRSWIRSFPTLGGAVPDLGPLPDSPITKFLEWLEEAVAAGVPEPHAAALSTVDSTGVPDARFLILKDVTDEGFWFSGDVRSPKGVQLGANPVAALTLYWREQGRQVRVRGVVREGGRVLSARDFRERSVTARAVAAASRQSESLLDPQEYTAAVESAVERIESDPTYVSDTWRAWCLAPDSVEFWQADPGRRHLRWVYHCDQDGWSHHELWP
ncbi:pyridoxal 5'-phosphate synthase [Rhodococcus sp. NPDC058521]|uniref:pyridoxine/pyridoxamine 5'-phosphate oxidase n=1 Tax=Rhodococcus sp. NPDC058521 TaxID=3346536 RepID=UPI0036686847